MARAVLTLGFGCYLAAASPSLRGQERRLNQTGYVPMLSSTTCTNSYGVEFTCGPNSVCCGDICLGGGSACCEGPSGSHFSCAGGSSCCGDTCVKAGDTCCTNDMGRTFACDSGSSCCGNTCVANQDKCCTDTAHGTKYAVSGGSPCISEMKNCTNRHGRTFFCGEDSECCGDGCVAAGAACCEGERGSPTPGGFSCGQYSQCCGSVCVAPGSMCCVDENNRTYPAAGTYVNPWDNTTYAHCRQV